jgi:hypothetical protein
MAASSPLEGIFSQTGDVANPVKRNRLTKSRINEIICVKSWEKIVNTIIEEDIISDDSNFNGEELLGSEELPLEIESTLPSSPLARRTLTNNSSDEDLYGP